MPYNPSIPHPDENPAAHLHEMAVEQYSGEGTTAAEKMLLIAQAWDQTLADLVEDHHMDELHKVVDFPFGFEDMPDDIQLAYWEAFYLTLEAPFVPKHEEYIALLETNYTRETFFVL